MADLWVEREEEGSWIFLFKRYSQDWELRGYLSKKKKEDVELRFVMQFMEIIYKVREQVLGEDGCWRSSGYTGCFQFL